MPGCPLRNTCVRPSWLTGRRDQRPARGGLIAGLALAGGVYQSDLFGLDLWEQSLLARRPYSRPVSHGCTQFQCGSRLAREGGGTFCIDASRATAIASKLAPTRLAVDTDLINDQKTVWERACSRWRPDSRPRLWEWSDKLSDSSRFFRRALAVAGWEGLSLTFSCRCKFSDRAWKPEVDGAKAPFITYADGRFLTLLSLWRLCAGDLRVCRARLPRFSNLRTAATHSLGNERGSSNQ
ncbi:hypothetical protein SAMN03159507_00986 [Pseudomonas sp. NFACC32-1]|nr:hypothetical protein SAMN03159507_00986 [Pseudomonas sp. NFACC32-1]